MAELAILPFLVRLCDGQRRSRMVMSIKGENLIADFVGRQKDAEKAMNRWAKVVKDATWNNPTDIHNTFSKVDTVKLGYIFNVRGNNYRIHASVLFLAKTVTVLKVRSHQDYDKWIDL